MSLQSEVDGQAGSTSKTRSAIVFFVSIALNFLLVGIILGGIWVNSKPKPKNKIEQFIQSLPEDKQTVVRSIVKGSREVREERRRSVRKAWRAASDKLDAGRYFRQELESSLLKLREARLSMITGRHELIVKIAEVLSPEERRTLKRFLKKRRHRK